MDRIKAGERLAPEELAKIRESLATRTADVDVYDLLRALAASAPPSHKDVKLAEEILQERKDSYAVKGAIWALCHHWGLTARYTTDLLEIAQPETWDTLSDAGIAALSELGAYLWREQDKSVYRGLLQLLKRDGGFESAGCEYFWPVHLECVVAALDQGLRGAEAGIEPIGALSFERVPREFMRAVELKARLH